MGRKLLLLIALLATLVVLGCWDNRRQMQRVLDEGYATTAQLTGAQYQRKLPLAADGWRPRLDEQEVSVDLTWQGKDVKAYSFANVPISEAFIRAAQQYGIPFNADFNGRVQAGIGHYQVTLRVGFTLEQ